MPHRRKSARTIVAEVVMYVGMAAVIGQMAATFWERFIIQTQLASMKSSLHTLKFTINNIGTAYDSLHKELRHLVAITEWKAFLPKSSTHPPVHCKHTRRHVDKKIPEDEIEVRAVMESKRGLDVATDFEKTMRDFIQVCKLPVCKNVSTLTRYPLKSTAVGKDEEFELDPKSNYYRLHRCYNRDNKDGGRIKPILQ